MYNLIKRQIQCELTFNDKSGDRVRGSIPVYYLAFFQKTWYELEFNAVIINDQKREIYNLNKDINFSQSNLKKTYD